MTNIFLAFIPIFVAVDAIGVLPIFISLTQGYQPEEKQKVIRQSLYTAVALAFGFIFLGKIIFRFLGITMSDFMVAGGLILFCIAILDLLRPGKQRRMPPKELGAVPIGTPLIVGPAVLTTSLMIVDQYGVTATLISVLCNIFLAGLIFQMSEKLIKFLGQAGARALSKVTMLLLAAIAVMMIRKGIFGILNAGG
ncbi:MAG: MarC family protein [Candidatus Omnitrophota bacterium]